MISVNDFKTGVTIEVDGNIWKVMEFQHVKPGKGAAFVRSKLRNMRTGAVNDKTFRAGEKVAKAQETDISDSAQNEVIQEEPDEIENKNENLKIEEEIAKVEESHNDDNMYYDIDSDSLINVFNNLENYQKNENEK